MAVTIDEIKFIGNIEMLNQNNFYLIEILTFLYIPVASGCQGEHLAARLGCYRDSAVATCGCYGYHEVAMTDWHFAAFPGCHENCEVAVRGCYGDHVTGCRDDCVTAQEGQQLRAMSGHCSHRLCVD